MFIGVSAPGILPAAWIAEVTHKRLTVFADEIATREKQILAPDPLRSTPRKSCRAMNRDQKTNG